MASAQPNPPCSTEEHGTSSHMLRSYHLNSCYRCVRVLGEGTYGVVYEAIHVPTGIHVALKHIRVSKRESQMTELSITAIREIVLLRELKHPHIVELIDVLHRNNNLFLVFELCETDLRHFLKEQNNLIKTASNESQTKTQPLLPFQHIRNVARQVIHALSYCHSRRIMHRDLKPQNILLNNKGSYVKIADLGLSRPFGDGTQLITNEVVTLWYRAPELLLGDKHYTNALDIWSLGCILVEMCTGKPLFYGSCETDTLFSIFQAFGTPIEPDTYKGDETLNHSFSHAYWNGVKKKPYYKTLFPMWRRNAFATLRQIMPYADNTFLDLIIKLLQYNPAQRPQTHEILRHPWFLQT